jgi:hypothetical protein
MATRPTLRTVNTLVSTIEAGKGMKMCLHFIMARKFLCRGWWDLTAAVIINHQSSSWRVFEFHPSVLWARPPLVRVPGANYGSLNQKELIVLVRAWQFVVLLLTDDNISLSIIKSAFLGQDYSSRHMVVRHEVRLLAAFHCRDWR